MVVGASPDAKPGFMVFVRNDGGEDSDDENQFKKDDQQLEELCKAPPLNGR